ncbi:MAG: DUF2889 domain-containing protein [Deltaproteobacteria bacterium]
MSLGDEIKKENRIHQRALEMTTYARDDDTVLVEGTLRDERFRPIYEISGQRREQGVIHHMIIRLLIGGQPLRILDAEAEMPQIPMPLCVTMAESVRKVIGLKIKSGFGERVHKLIGGKQGCAHLTHLLTVMVQEALHGYWTHKMRKPGPPPASIEEIEGLSYLLNSCSLWREDGPIMQEIKEFIEHRRVPA